MSSYQTLRGVMRLNVGCGDFPLPGWINLDQAPDVRADVVAHVPPLPYADGRLDEIYAGHFLEHLPRAEATVFLAECGRCLRPGGRLGVLVPDTREIMRRWLAGAPDLVEYPEGAWHPIADLEFVCQMFLYSTIQESHHVWSYDADTLAAALIAAGFRDLRPIDREHDPRLGTGRWYQVGWDSVKP